MATGGADAGGDDGNSNSDAPAPLSLDLLAIANDARSMYGLRQQDYARYRRYCARRIRRMRKAVGLVQTAGSGTGGSRNRSKPYQHRPLVQGSPALADPRSLQLLLFDAERSWAHAMELRASIQTEPRRRHHLIRRLRHAADAAASLHALCQSPVADTRTELETQAYAALLAAYVAFERQEWQSALDLFASARVIYERLVTVASSPTQAALCQSAIDEIDPNVRYCAYNMRTRATAASTTGSQQSLDIASLLELRSKSLGPGHDMLTSKIEALLADNFHAEARQRSHDISWRGLTLRISDDHLMERIIESQELHLQISKECTIDKLVVRGGDGVSGSAVLDEAMIEDALAQYGKLLGLGWDAAKLAEKAIKEDAAATAKIKSSKSDEHTQMLQNVFSYVSYTRLEHALERARLLIEISAIRLQQQEAVGAGDRRGERRDILVKLDMGMHQTLKEMASLPIMSSDVSLSHVVTSRDCVVTAQRLMHTADYYAGESKFGEALALLDKTSEAIEEARAALTKAQSRWPKVGVDGLDCEWARLASVEQAIRARVVTCKAKWVLMRGETEGSSMSLTDAIDGISLSAKATSTASSTMMVSADGAMPVNMDTLFVPPATQQMVVQALPPRMKPAPFKAVLYDMAYPGIGFPHANLRRMAAGKPRIGRLDSDRESDVVADAVMADASSPRVVTPAQSPGFLGSVLGSLWGSSNR